MGGIDFYLAHTQGDPCCHFHPDRSLCLHVAHPGQDPHAGIILVNICGWNISLRCGIVTITLAGFIRCLPLHGDQLT